MEMSDNIYANTGISAELKFDSSDSDDEYEDIDANEQNCTTYETKNTKDSEKPVSVINTADSRYYKVTVGCLGLLSVLLLVGISVLCLKFTAERNQLQTKYDNMTIEQDQLQISNVDLRRDKDQLNDKLKQITDEKEKLQTSYNIMKNQQDQLQKEKDGLQKRLTDCECFKIGYQVRVKASVSSPKYQWGSASHKSVGVVTAVNGESMTVDFPEHKSWKAAVSEMELAPSTDLGNFRIGDQVRVKASVTTPKYKWGSASHKSVGVVTAVNGESMTVDFPEHKSWNAAVSEMELAQC
ncbi:hypothetical protein MHYP_G00058440 [Metynnis hypsauchen]